MGLTRGKLVQKIILGFSPQLPWKKLDWKSSSGVTPSLTMQINLNRYSPRFFEKTEALSIIIPKAKNQSTPSYKVHTFITTNFHTGCTKMSLK